MNGKEAASKTEVEHLVVKIPEAKVAARRTVENYATNPAGKNYPLASASYTNTGSSNVWQGVDGRIFYDYLPRNRWDNYNSPNAEDWYAVDFGPGRERTINEVRVYVYSDAATGQGNVGMI